MVAAELSMPRPRKNPNETKEGKRKLKREQKQLIREMKAKEKQERKDRFENGLCKAPDGSIVSFREVGYFGAVGGTQAWEDATQEEKERRKFMGRTAYHNMDPGRQMAVEEAGRRGGIEAHINASEAEIEEMKQAGKAEWENADAEVRERRKHIGRETFINMNAEEQQAVIEAGRQGGLRASQNWTDDQRTRIVAAAAQGRNTIMTQAAIKHSTPGKPSIIPIMNSWDCRGRIGDEVCRFRCVKNIRVLSFIDVPELPVLEWLVAHKLQDSNCNRFNCSGQCFAISLGDSVGLKCRECNFISKGGLRSFWCKGRLGPVKMFALTFAIVTGYSFMDLYMFGIKVNKNTWTRYVKDVGLVAAEALERNRRNDSNRYANAQWDETACGRRKYHRGSRRRKAGVQWVLTCVNVDPITNKTLNVDLQFLPYNRRDAEQISKLVEQRMVPGGVMTTDMWRAYPHAAELAMCQLYTVNHSKGFKDPVTGRTTNNCEGIHGVIKRAAHKQFGRLPYLNSTGECYYLDLLVWRENKNLEGLDVFMSYCMDLWFWTNRPLEDFDHIIPIVEDVENESDDEDDDDVDEEGTLWFDRDPRNIDPYYDVDDPDWE